MMGTGKKKKTVDLTTLIIYISRYLVFYHLEINPFCNRIISDFIVTE
jgi:hypothetical protein